MFRLFILAALLVASAPVVSAEPEATEIALMIGPTRSVVRELREVAFTARVCDVVFEGIPATADLATLQVGGERQGVRLLGWQRESAPATPSSGVVWRPGEPLRREVPDGRSGVRCHLESTSLRARLVELVYQVEGLAWRADYEVTIRGDVANHVEPLSLDLEGRLVISNGTDRLFGNAQVLLVGVEHEATARAGPSADQLMLDDSSPLADLWRRRPQPPNFLHAYPVKRTVNLPAFAETSLSFVETRRQAADRLYRMAADDVPLNAESAWRPLVRYLTLPNDAGHGLGQVLPPGDALVYLGGTRGGPYQRARLAHTERGGEIQVSLGEARGVTATRRSEPRVVGMAGMPEQTVVVQLANALPTPVNVEVAERPPVPLAWDIVRSSHPFDKRDQRLFFKMQIEPRSEVEINYTVRTTEPEP